MFSFMVPLVPALWHACCVEKCHDIVPRRPQGDRPQRRVPPGMVACAAEVGDLLHFATTLAMPPGACLNSFVGSHSFLSILASSQTRDKPKTSSRQAQDKLNTSSRQAQDKIQTSSRQLNASSSNDALSPCSFSCPFAANPSSNLLREDS